MGKVLESKTVIDDAMMDDAATGMYVQPSLMITLLPHGKMARYTYPPLHKHFISYPGTAFQPSRGRAPIADGSARNSARCSVHRLRCFFLFLIRLLFEK